MKRFITTAIVLGVSLSALMPIAMLGRVSGVRPDLVGRIEDTLDSVVIVGTATGFVVHRDGTVLTAAHCVGDEEQVAVALHDGRKCNARVLVADKNLDLALLSTGIAGLPAVRIAKQDPRLGDSLWVVGHPIGLHYTVTAGVVSRLNADMDPKAGVVFHNIMQTDASINPGNSGGPVMTARFEVVGLVDATIMEAHCVGFCIGRRTIADFLRAHHIPVE